MTRGVPTVADLPHRATGETAPRAFGGSTRWTCPGDPCALGPRSLSSPQPDGWLDSGSTGWPQMYGGPT
jgi:hypothetical protein